MCTRHPCPARVHRLTRPRAETKSDEPRFGPRLVWGGSVLVSMSGCGSPGRFHSRLAADFDAAEGGAGLAQVEVDGAALAEDGHRDLAVDRRAVGGVDAGDFDDI